MVLDEQKMIMIGTAGYSYDDWVGNFYPPGIDHANRLSYYAQKLPFVELNASYYNILTAKITADMVAKSPPGFYFVVKVHRDITQQRKIDDCGRLLTGLTPMVEAQCLGCVLAQFPFTFRYTKDNRDFLEYLAAALSPVALVLEFANSRWLREEVVRYWQRRGIGIVSGDHLQRQVGSIPLAGGGAGSLSYLRLGGPRREPQGTTHSNLICYDHLYTEDELAPWITRVRKLIREVACVFVSFNNHSRGNAALNAELFRQMLQKDAEMASLVK